MKRSQCLAVLCALACTITSVSADENGFESAAPSVETFELINPQPGVIFSAYPLEKWMVLSESEETRLRINVGLGDGELDQGQKQKTQLWVTLSTLQKKAPLKSGIDKNDKFSLQCATGVDAAIVKWEGFLKCKLSRTYTFMIQKGYYNGVLNTQRWLCGYAVRINGKFGLAGYGQTTFDAKLNAGFNKIEIVSLVPRHKDVQDAPLSISAKIKGGLAEPTAFSPGMLFYDDKPELHEIGF